LPQLANIALDGTASSIAWLSGSQWVQGKPVGLWGVSRGAEQALILSTLVGNQILAAVAVHAPNDQVVGSYDPRTDNAVPGAPAAWTWAGAPLGPTTDGAAGQRIEVEKYLGPLHLSHGEQDTLWPVSYSQAIYQTRQQLVPLVPTTLKTWPGQGHTFGTQALQDQYLEILVGFFATYLGQ
jgi:dienelactone hydrolase